MVKVTLISYFNERKMRLGVGNGHRILLTVEEGCVFMRLNHAYTGFKEGQQITSPQEGSYPGENKVFPDSLMQPNRKKDA